LRNKDAEDQEEKNYSPDPADTARVPTNAQRAIVARWPGPGVGGEELG